MIQEGCRFLSTWDAEGFTVMKGGHVLPGPWGMGARASAGHRKYTVNIHSLDLQRLCPLRRGTGYGTMAGENQGKKRSRLPTIRVIGVFTLNGVLPAPARAPKGITLLSKEEGRGAGVPDPGAELGARLHGSPHPGH